MAKYLYNGVLLPEIPADMFANYPYVWIRKDGSNANYNLILAKNPWYRVDTTLYHLMSEPVPYYSIAISGAESAETWGTTQYFTGGFGLASNRTVLWSNHDIPNGSADSTDIYFYGSEPVDPNAPVEPEEPEVYYKISGTRLKGFADQARRLGKFTGELTPEQIEDTLKWIETGLTEEEAQAMVEAAIANLQLQSKTVTPTDAEQTITADEVLTLSGFVK